MTLGSHQQTVGRSQVHITPKRIIDRLGPFDMDPCAASPRPWDCARVNITEKENGLIQSWHGRVWLNPPFDQYVVRQWIARLAEHGQGTALLHARTEAGWFEPVWESASGILFMADRIHFHRPDGSRQPANSGAPPVLVAFGEQDLVRLRDSGIAGRLVTQWQTIEASAPKSAELTASRLEPRMSMANPKSTSQLNFQFEHELAGATPASAVPQPQPEPELQSQPQGSLDVSGLTAEQRRGFVGYDKDGRFVHYCHCGEWGAFGYGVFLSRGQLGK
jgi:DNA N-6-adenine-methyltransferase (Dam)